MRTLDRYIGMTVAKGFFLVTLILLSAFYLLELVDQLEDVGKGNYRLPDAFAFVSLMLPRQLLDLIPVTALLGSCIALGSLADRGELVAIRAAGVSALRLGWSAMRPGVLLMLAVVILEEFIAPPLQQFALRRQSLAIAGVEQSEQGFTSSNSNNARNGAAPAGIDIMDRGLWSRDGLRFINVGDFSRNRLLNDIDIYEFDQQGQLLTFIHADKADIGNDKKWLLLEVQRKVLKDQDIAKQRLATMQWESFLTAEQIRTAEKLHQFELPAQSMAPSALYDYINGLHNNGKPADRYQLALWQKLSLPLTTGAMLLLSIAFVLGLSIATAGQRIIVGSVVGIAFYLGNQIIANVGLLLKLSAPLTAITPAIAILCVAGVLMRRL